MKIKQLAEKIKCVETFLLACHDHPDQRDALMKELLDSPEFFSRVLRYSINKDKLLDLIFAMPEYSRQLAYAYVHMPSSYNAADWHMPTTLAVSDASMLEVLRFSELQKLESGIALIADYLPNILGAICQNSEAFCDIFYSTFELAKIIKLCPQHTTMLIEAFLLQPAQYHYEQFTNVYALLVLVESAPSFRSKLFQKFLAISPLLATQTLADVVSGLPFEVAILLNKGLAAEDRPGEILAKICHVYNETTPILVDWLCQQEAVFKKFVGGNSDILYLLIDSAPQFSQELLAAYMRHNALSVPKNLSTRVANETAQHLFVIAKNAKNVSFAKIASFFPQSHDAIVGTIRNDKALFTEVVAESEYLHSLHELLQNFPSDRDGLFATYCDAYQINSTVIEKNYDLDQLSAQLICVILQGKSPNWKLLNQFPEVSAACKSALLTELLKKYASNDSWYSYYKDIATHFPNDHETIAQTIGNNPTLIKAIKSNNHIRAKIDFALVNVRHILREAQNRKPKPPEDIMMTLAGIIYFAANRGYSNDPHIQAARKSTDREQVFATKLSALQQMLTTLPDDEARIKMLCKDCTIYYSKWITRDTRTEREKDMDTLPEYEDVKHTDYQSGTLFYFIAAYGSAKQLIALLELLQIVFVDQASLSQFVLSKTGIVTHGYGYDKHTTLPSFISEKEPPVDRYNYTIWYDNQASKQIYRDKFTLLHYLQNQFGLTCSAQLIRNVKLALPSRFKREWQYSTYNFYEKMQAELEALSKPPKI